MISMKRIVVTGATGYIGSNLVRKLVNEKNEVYIVVRKNSVSDLLGDIKNKINVFVYDNNIENLIEFFINTKPDVVYHLASLFIAEHNFNDIDNLIDSNIKFGTELLEAMNLSGVKKLINTGTSWQHYNNESYNPVCLYAATKEAFEKVIEYYTNTCGFKVVTLELFDTYGPNDNRKKIINLLSKYSKDKTLLKMSAGEQLLDLTYIDDVTGGFYYSLDQLDEMKNCSHKKYAISSEVRHKLKDIINIYENVTGNKVLVEWGARPYRDREVMEPCTLINVLPGWKAEIKLEEGLRIMNKINHSK